MAEQRSRANGDYLRDVESLSATDLRKKYPREFNSWRNGKRRAGVDWAPAFSDWRDFLRIMGPAGEGETLDRKNNDDPRYGPGLCEWRSKKAQANNRLSTYRFGDEALTDFAARRGLSERTLRAMARRSNPFGANPLAFKPWPQDRAPWWETRYKEGSHLREYRFEYFIRRLRRQHALEEQWVRDHEDDWHSDDPEVRARAEERGREIRRLTETLIQAQVDYDAWLPFAETFIRRHPGVGKDGQTRIRPDDGD